jgi:uncharacterized protein
MADAPPELAPGTPCWVDLSTSDLDSGRRFYAGLFGWTSQVAEDPQAGGYTLFHLDGKLVGGAGPLMDGGHAAWNTYFRTLDAAQTAGKVREAGGQVFVEPMDVLGEGTMAVFRDPAGAFFSVWQYGRNTGAEVFNIPGSLSWNELSTRDPAGARAFYSAVFGWGAKGQDKEYVEFQVDGRSIGGMIDMNARNLPAQIPSYWLVYFTVADCDAAAARSMDLGGTTRRPAMDIPGLGRFAVLADPQGAAFAVISLNRP